MAINLDKAVEQVKIVLEKNNFDKKGHVILALDISGSMHGMFSDGTVQEIVERILAIGINMDDNREIDVFLFGGSSIEAKSATINNIKGYTQKEITSKYNLQNTTEFALVIKDIAKKYGHLESSVEQQVKGIRRFFKNKIKSFLKETPNNVSFDKTPVIVFFITDGDNFDHSRSEVLIKKLSNKPIFWQFVGIGNSHFSFLEKLDKMEGRTVDNANFFDAGDIKLINDSVLYDRILNELPLWYKEAKSKNIVN